jgi:hypothetical protein
LIFLIDKITSSIQGPYSNINGKPISGVFPVFVDYDDFIFDTSTFTLSSLLSQKTTRTLEEAGTFFTVVSSVTEDFISEPDLSVTYSLKYTSGPDRHCSVAPGGFFFVGSNISGYNFFSTPSDLFLKYNVYKHSSGYAANAWGAPERIIDTSMVHGVDVSVSIYDSAGSLLGVVPDGHSSPGWTYTGDFYVVFRNISSERLIISDFTLAWS